MSNIKYDFSRDYFSHNRPTWDILFNQFKPVKILEIGSFEGESTTYMIEKTSSYSSDVNVEIHCIDTWQGGEEHASLSMESIEKSFANNVQVALKSSESKAKVLCHKGLSSIVLPRLINEYTPEYFDFIYIDGSHQAKDVLSDAVLSYLLLRKGGLLIFDDYLWEFNGSKDLKKIPKLAIDSFLNCYSGQLEILFKLPIYQMYVVKRA